MVLTSQGSISTAYHPGCPVWVPERRGGANVIGQKAVRWVKGIVTGTSRDVDGSTVLQVHAPLLVHPLLRQGWWLPAGLPRSAIGLVQDQQAA